MKTHFDIEQFIIAGTIRSELDYERAMAADRKLRLLAKDSAHFKKLRSKLRDLIEAYEAHHWSDHKAVTRQQIYGKKKSHHPQKIKIVRPYAGRPDTNTWAQKQNPHVGVDERDQAVYAFRSYSNQYIVKNRSSRTCADISKPGKKATRPIGPSAA